MPYFEALVLTLCLIAGTGPANAQARRPVTFSTPHQTIKLKTRSTDGPEVVLNARAAYTVTSANIDDTLTGTLTLTFPDELHKHSKSGDRPGSGKTPAPRTEPGVIASFRKDTGCPIIRLEIGPLEWSSNGVVSNIQPFQLFIPEARDEMSQLLCFWTKQINTKGHRRGIIAKINRLIAGDEEPQ